MPITLIHITYVFNVTNADYLSTKLLSKVDKKIDSQKYSIFSHQANFDINQHKILPSYLL